MPLRWLAVATCVALAGACGSDEAEPGAELPGITADTGGAAQTPAPLPDTSAAQPSETAPADTPSASTPPGPDPSPTASTSAVGTTTTSEVAASTTIPEPTTTGWTALDPDSVPPFAFPPCCGDTWHGAVSPPLAPVAQPLADGPYAVAMQWPNAPVEALELEVFRFDRCAVLPVSACEQPGTGFEFEPDQLGVDVVESSTITVPLDAAVGAVVVGWATVEPADPGGPLGQFVIEEATGVELAALAADVERAYEEVFAARLAAGEDPDAIIADVRSNPTDGFGPGLGSIGAVAITPQSGPPLLFQAVYPYVDGQRTVGRGTDVLSIRSLEMVDGRITLYVYGAYYP